MDSQQNLYQGLEQEQLQQPVCNKKQRLMEPTQEQEWLDEALFALCSEEIIPPVLCTEVEGQHASMQKPPPQAGLDDIIINESSLGKEEEVDVASLPSSSSSSPSGSVQSEFPIEEQDLSLLPGEEEEEDSSDASSPPFARRLANFLVTEAFLKSKKPKESIKNLVGQVANDWAELESFQKLVKELDDVDMQPVESPSGMTTTHQCKFRLSQRPIHFESTFDGKSGELTSQRISKQG